MRLNIHMAQQLFERDEQLKDACGEWLAMTLAEIWPSPRPERWSI
jgi:hypothetical protein